MLNGMLGITCHQTCQAGVLSDRPLRAMIMGLCHDHAWQCLALPFAFVVHLASC